MSHSYMPVAYPVIYFSNKKPSNMFLKKFNATYVKDNIRVIDTDSGCTIVNTPGLFYDTRQAFSTNENIQQNFNAYLHSCDVVLPGNPKSVKCYRLFTKCFGGTATTGYIIIDSEYSPIILDNIPLHIRVGGIDLLDTYIETNYNTGSVYGMGPIYENMTNSSLSHVQSIGTQLDPTHVLHDYLVDLQQQQQVQPQQTSAPLHRGKLAMSYCNILTELLTSEDEIKGIFDKGQLIQTLNSLPIADHLAAATDALIDGTSIAQVETDLRVVIKEHLTTHLTTITEALVTTWTDNVFMKEESDTSSIEEESITNEDGELVYVEHNTKESPKTAE